MLLKQLILNEGKHDVCTMCDTKGQVLSVESNRLFQLVKALVRYYYSEWEYNPHWGGDSYHSLFYGESNRFFNEYRAKSELEYEEIILSIVDGDVYEYYDAGVSVFSGYDDYDRQNLLLESISTDLDSYILDIAKRLKNENYFHFEKDIKEILSSYQNIASLPLKKDKILYRARIGFKDKVKKINYAFDNDYHYIPYQGSDIDAPPPHLATNGRINRVGVSFLYCATDKYTAIAEVRPHPGDRVSLAELQLNSDITVYDLSDSQLLNFFESDKSLDDYIPLNTLGTLIRKTIPPSEKDHYSITQLIADCIRQLGYEGIIFNSSVGKGKNIVLFDQSKISQNESNAEVIYINSVKYECEPNLSRN